jgi:hypothetical protein
MNSQLTIVQAVIFCTHTHKTHGSMKTIVNVSTDHFEVTSEALPEYNVSMNKIPWQTSTNVLRPDAILFRAEGFNMVLDY